MPNGAEVLSRWVDDRGGTHQVPAATLRRARHILTEEHPLAGADDPVVLTQGADYQGRGILELEDGRELRLHGRLPADCPLGYHVLHEGPDKERAFIVCPPRCFLPERQWGLMAQLYAARSRTSWGIGDLADLGQLRDWAGTLGAGFVLVNPLGAVAPSGAQEPSPYSPASRRFRNPIYLRVEEIPGVQPSDIAGIGDRGRALNESAMIDRDAVWELKARALRQIFDRQGCSAEFVQWRQTQGHSLEDFATWCALTVQFGPIWTRWPDEFRAPNSPAVARFHASAGREVNFWAWLQWHLHRQLTAGTPEVGVVQDLPIGFHPQGADAWCWQHLLADGVSVGAPPDRLMPDGQDWGVTPFVPSRLRAAGYRPFLESIRAALQEGGGLRIDHVMGLHRLWWVFDGRSADGAYVRYPVQELLNLISLESVRARAFVVGEDLGTVTAELRAALRSRGVLSTRVLWFEDDDPSTWPIDALGTINTHDLPTVMGVWTGSDAADQQTHGSGSSAIAEIGLLRTKLGKFVDAEADRTDVLTGAAAHLCRSPSRLLAVSVEDLLGVEPRPNMPGSVGRSNWSYALPMPLEEARQTPSAERVAAAFRNS